MTSEGRPPAPLLLRVAEHGDLFEERLPIFLGRLGRHACFAVDLSEVSDVALLNLPGRFLDLRMTGSFMSAEALAVLFAARGLVHWHAEAKHCGRCGARTEVRDGGHVRVCPACQRVDHPRTDPAVMVLVVRDDRCLLARQPQFPPGMYSALAGFVEPGESLEEAVHRETHEEVGLRLRNLQYQRSQAWPFPRSLMLSFVAEADDGDVILDRDELEDFRWVHHSEIEQPQGFSIPPPVSLAHRLIREWATRGRDV